MDYFNNMFSENFTNTIGKILGTSAIYEKDGSQFSIPGSFVGYIEDTSQSGNYETVSAYTAEFKVAKNVFIDFDIDVPNKNEKLLINNKTYNIETIKDDETGIMDFMLLEIEPEKIELSAKRRIR